MMLKIRFSLLLIILSILFYSCEKEFSLEGNVLAGTSEFSLIGSPGACSNTVVTGTYQAGVALGATNIATIAVEVTTAGTYSIATTTINGISFAGSGTFTATGPQTISLIGSGTPDAPGIFSFTPGTNGCSFPITISTTGETAVYTLDGAPGSCTSFTPGGTYNAGTALGPSNIATVSVNVTTVGTYNIATNNVNGISFSASDTFTTTGTQVVQLSGSGTPLVGGVFDYTPGTNGCTFSITVTGSSSDSAVYTYDGAPDSCTGATTSGSFSVGSDLTASNTVTVNVNVTTIGAYSILTPTVNGFFFAASGNFTVAGAQSVTLIGTGTPAAEGVFDFTPSNNGCSFSITVGTSPTDFLSCTIDGVDRTFNVNLEGLKTDSSTFDISGEETSAGTSPFFIISLGKSPAITTGTYDWLTAITQDTFCLVGYSDGFSSTGWVSAISGQSVGFTVIVTNYTANRIEGTFSGNLYDNDGQGSSAIVITNGQFSVPY